MKDFTYQVYRFTDAAKFVPSRVNPEAIKALSLPDVEKTFPELQARIKQTIEYIEGVEESSFTGRESSEVVLKFGPTKEFKFQALEYVLTFAQPNFWFHVTTAYDILRMKGVDVGKNDFLNGAGLTTPTTKE